MPWIPELFSEPVLERLREKRERERLEAVPYYDGLMSGEHEALIRSFAGEPVLHDPLHGRIKGVRAFEWYVTALKALLARQNMSFDPVDDVHHRGGAQFEEVVLHLDGQDGRVEVPVAIVADRESDGRLDRAARLPQHVAGAGPPRAPPAHAAARAGGSPVGRRGRVPARARGRRRRRDRGDVRARRLRPRARRRPVRPQRKRRAARLLRALFSNGGGIPLEHCAMLDNGRACALEYNVVRWGRTELSPEAGVAVYVRGESGKLAAARIYDDADPPIS